MCHFDLIHRGTTHKWAFFPHKAIVIWSETWNAMQTQSSLNVMHLWENPNGYVINVYSGRLTARDKLHWYNNKTANENHKCIAVLSWNRKRNSEVGKFEVKNKNKQCVCVSHTHTLKTKVWRFLIRCTCRKHKNKNTSALSTGEQPFSSYIFCACTVIKCKYQKYDTHMALCKFCFYWLLTTRRIVNRKHALLFFGKIYTKWLCFQCSVSLS